MALALAVPHEAQALRCKEWNRIPPEQKPGTVSRMIDERLTGNRARRYRTADKYAIRQCLGPLEQRIVGEFDYTCAQGQRVSMGELDRIFDNYIRSCVR